jgi:hypothetical protein
MSVKALGNFDRIVNLIQLLFLIGGFIIVGRQVGTKEQMLEQNRDDIKELNGTVKELTAVVTDLGQTVSGLGAAQNERGYRFEDIEHRLTAVEQQLRDVK